MAHSHDHGHAPDYRAAIEEQRAAKDAFFRASPHSPLPDDQRTSFGGLAYFPVGEAYSIDGLSLLPYVGDGPAAFAMPTSDDRTRDAHRAGSFVFEIRGLRQVLTAYELPETSGHGLFVPFLDATSGIETYGAGRYLDVEPDHDGLYTIDFNLAYHPFCAYAPHYSCPLTPAENRLGVRVEAGERS